ncbi:hypothetical protein Acid345_3658 [Candidatus Koribacter versatilis Ellin345]|uniref:Uncharacterized protein n=1 Tax=Koribacter versatilis (strain Ellin345) TaxID=204669 RepID=Q1IKE1_KORVE|nr:hypothetical protein [Candidatus Koribacter versatilis]ABF42659.1 hypothetical protein Acid345_3658 [Candidatus Koribacter versatilis Ellin345]
MRTKFRSGDRRRYDIDMRFAAFTLALMLALPALAQSHAKRLILKDGSYQSILEYKVEGDRVRYKSADRFEWEDVPNLLVDWDATNKYNDNPIKNDLSRAERDAAEAEEKEAARTETDAPTVAPRLRLPDGNIGGVYLLDEWKGAPELVEIVQNGADINQNFGKNVLRVAVNPFGGAHQSFELPGQHARAQSHSTQPTFYMCIESGEKPVDVVNHYRIVRVTSDVKKNTRSVGTLIVKATGKTSQAEKFVPALVSHVNEGPWVKVTPSQPLTPGEYAVVEMLDENEMNLYVWDFGVNADAPENVNAVKAKP